MKKRKKNVKQRAKRPHKERFRGLQVRGNARTQKNIRKKTP